MAGVSARVIELQDEMTVDAGVGGVLSEVEGLSRELILSMFLAELLSVLSVVLLLRLKLRSEALGDGI